MATIEITKAEAKEAGVFKSEMYENLKEAREATGDNKIVIHRTNEFFFKFAWKHNPILGIRNYTFKISNTNYRVIPEYHDLLELHVI